MADLVGTVLRNRYRIVKLLGRGGMADVYLAMDDERNVEVAIKVMREDYAEEPEFIKRFRREAQALAKLDHPYIVRFYSFEQEGRFAFIVMDYVRGDTLRGRMRDVGGPLPLEETTRILQQVGSALNFAHRQGFLHRDIKPANIMLREDGTALLSDFGIAQTIEATTISAVAGTPAYMSPEQILDKDLDNRADIYSLGIVLYEMTTGRRPFIGKMGTGTTTQRRVQDEHLHLPPPDPRQFNLGLPEGVAAVILRALAKRPEARWPDVASMVAAWDEAVNGIQATLQAPEIAAVVPVSQPAVSSAQIIRLAKNTPTPIKKNDHTPLVIMAVCVLLAMMLCSVAVSALLKRVEQLGSAVTSIPTKKVISVPATVPVVARTSGDSLIAYQHDRDGTWQIYLINADGSGQTRLTNGSDDNQSPDWSPDGSRIAFVSNRDGTSQIYLMNADGSDQTRLTNSNYNNESPDWLPDGKRIAFQSDRNGTWQIYVMNIDGSGQTRLTNGNHDNVLPDWSPDGSHVVFVSNRDGTSQIYVMNADGSDQTRLTSSGLHNYSPTWSPDGSRIAFESYRQLYRAIFVMNADGSGQTRLTDVHDFTNQSPAWSPDGNRIAFEAYRDSTWQIHVMNADGSGQMYLTTGIYDASRPVWSPVGSK